MSTEDRCEVRPLHCQGGYESSRHVGALSPPPSGPAPGAGIRRAPEYTPVGYMPQLLHGGAWRDALQRCTHNLETAQMVVAAIKGTPTRVVARTIVDVVVES